MLLVAQCRRGRARYGPTRHKVPALECRKLPLQLAYSFSFPLAQVRPSSPTPRDKEKRLACAALPATGNATLFLSVTSVRPPAMSSVNPQSLFTLWSSAVALTRHIVIDAVLADRDLSHCAFGKGRVTG